MQACLWKLGHEAFGHGVGWAPTHIGLSRCMCMRKLKALHRPPPWPCWLAVRPVQPVLGAFTYKHTVHAKPAPAPAPTPTHAHTTLTDPLPRGLHCPAPQEWYDFRLDAQDWSKVCWGRLPRAQGRSFAHQLARRAKWAAVLAAARTPSGGGWADTFDAADVTPQRLGALAACIDAEFFQV